MGEGRGGGYPRLKLLATGALAVLLFVVGLRKLDPFVNRFYIRTTAAAYGIEETRVELQGVLVRHEDVVRAPAPGRVTLLVGEGRRVRRGDVIAEVNGAESTGAVDARPVGVDHRLNRARAEFDAMRATLEREARSLSQRFDAAERALREALSRGDSDAAARHLMERDQVAAALADVRAQMDARTEEFRRLEEELLAQRRAALTARPGDVVLVTSPGSGIVSFAWDGQEEMRPGSPLSDTFARTFGGEERLQDGRRVEAGEPLFRLVDLAAGVELHVEGRGKPPVAPGTAVNLTFEHIPERSFTGRLVEVLADDRRWWGRVAVAHPDETLVQRRRVRVTLAANRAQGVVVPAQAVVQEGQRTGVYVMLGDRPVFREVVVLGGNERRLVIDSPRGVPVGAPVVINPRAVRDRAP